MQNPGSSKMNTDQIKPQMAVVGSNNDQFAVVDHIEGKSLKLTKDDKGQHHYIPLAWVKTVDDKVHVAHTQGEIGECHAGLHAA